VYSHWQVRLVPLLLEENLPCPLRPGLPYCTSTPSPALTTSSQVRLVLRLLEEHPRLPLVVVADSDTVWLRQPWAYFEQRPSAEFFISSDCLSPQVGTGHVGRGCRV